MQTQGLHLTPLLAGSVGSVSRPSDLQISYIQSNNSFYSRNEKIYTETTKLKKCKINKKIPEKSLQYVPTLQIFANFYEK